MKMILDTAADISTISEHWFKKNIPDTAIKNVKVNLQDYNKKKVSILGQVEVLVNYGGQSKNLKAVVVSGNRPCLFGKDWIRTFKLNWKEIFTINQVSLENKCSKLNLSQLIAKYNDLFKASSTPIKHFKAEIRLMNNAKPTFCKSRPVPYSLKLAVEREIRKAKGLGVWKTVEYSKWATPIVVVPKKNNEVRICGDFKVTVNRFIDVNKYPLPTQQDLFSTLSGGVCFTKLDMRHAYQQVELESSAQELLTLNTHSGLVRPTRLLYGISSAAAIFQNIMDQILHGLPFVICYQDDILITGASEEEHLANLEIVFERLKKFEVTLNYDKCKFLQDRVTYLGHVVDKRGIHPTDEKISAIKNVKSPKNITELRSFLGLLNYYAKFIKGTTALLQPLYELLHKNVKWNWSKQCESAFKRCKQILTSESVLVHYDANKQIKLQCDASPYGLGAVLSHTMDDGKDRPVAYASRTMTKTETGYSQMEREALAIIFGLKKFQQYLFGRSFIIVTDHRPLVTIFGPNTAIPALAAARIQRWALLMSSFQYCIEHKKGTEHTNADALSKLPSSENFEIEGDIFKISYVEDLPITSQDISRETRNDSVLGRVYNNVKYGWRSEVDNDIKHYHARREQLAIDGDCVTWGMHVILPKIFWERILELLHDTHLGSTRMKAIARSHVWWPNIDQQIEQLAKTCNACQQHQKMPGSAPLQSWVWPKAPWKCIHIDYAQKEKKFFMIVVDGHSKWVEVESMPQTTATCTIVHLRQMFSRYGLPMEVVSDNGPQLISEEFKHFLKQNGIKQTLIPTYHPMSNGSAERAVQSFKTALSKMNDDDQDHTTLSHKISRYLLAQHITPHSTTGKSPSELFLGRSLRSHISLVHPELSAVVESQQMKQKLAYDRSHSTIQKILPGQKVWVRQYTPGSQKWTEGFVIERQGTRTYKVRQEEKENLVHIDQIRPSSSLTHLDDDGHQNANGNQGLIPGSDTEEMEFMQDIDLSSKVVPASEKDPETKKDTATEVEQIQKRYPSRTRRSPDRWNW